MTIKTENEKQKTAKDISQENNIWTQKLKLQHNLNYKITWGNRDSVLTVTQALNVTIFHMKNPNSDH